MAKISEAIASLGTAIGELKSRVKAEVSDLLHTVDAQAQTIAELNAKVSTLEAKVAALEANPDVVEPADRDALDAITNDVRSFDPKSI